MYPLRGGGCGGRRRLPAVPRESGALFRKNERFSRELSKKRQKSVCISCIVSVKSKISILVDAKIIVKHVGLFRQRRESVVKYVGLYRR